VWAYPLIHRPICQHYGPDNGLLWNVYTSNNYNEEPMAICAQLRPRPHILYPAQLIYLKIETTHDDKNPILLKKGKEKKINFNLIYLIKQIKSFNSNSLILYFVFFRLCKKLFVMMSHVNI
jgi:hypothetical protein